MERSETVVRVASLRIPVRELERSRSYYCQRLGLKQGRSDKRLRTVTLLPALPHGPVLELVETDDVPPMHFPTRDGRIQPIIRLHSSDLEGMYTKLIGTNLTPLHMDLPDDGCGRFFEAADPDGTWLQYHVNLGEPVIMAATTEAAVNVEIPVSDVRRSAAFYENVGFSLDREPDETIAFLSAGHLVNRFGYTNVPEFGVILTRRDDDFPLMRFSNGEHWEPVIALQTENIAAYRSGLVDNGVEASDWQRGGMVGSFLIHDPDGHKLGVRRLNETFVYGANATV